MAPVRAIENCRKDERKVRKGRQRIAKRNDPIRRIGRESSMNNRVVERERKPRGAGKKARQRTNSP